MKRMGFFLVLVLASGCATSPMSSAQRRFHKAHPDATIIAQDTNDVTEHTGYWPHNTTRRYANYTFRYCGADGVEHEEVWHYEYLHHGWTIEKKQTR
jgi:hypothetical protein